VLARVVAACAVAFWGVLFFGVQDFLTPLVEGEDFAAHYLIETGWGLTYLVLVAVPLATLAVRPGRVVALVQVGLVGAALAVGALLAGSQQHLLPAGGVMLTAVVLAWLGRARSPMARTRRWGRPAPVTGLLAGVAVLPAAAYAWDMARSTENPEETWGLDHYPVQAAFAVAVVLVALLAAYAATGHSRGRWLPALTAAFSAAWFGVLCTIWPDRLGSPGVGWAVVAIGWAVVLVAAVAAEGRGVPVHAVR